MAENFSWQSKFFVNRVHEVTDIFQVLVMFINLMEWGCSASEYISTLYRNNGKHTGPKGRISKIDLLKEQISKLTAENIELKKEKAGFMARIMELERND